MDEDAIRDRTNACATEVRDTVYKGDDAALKAVLDKSWVYMQRAHLHAGGMGTTALVLIVLVSLLDRTSRPHLTGQPPFMAKARIWHAINCPPWRSHGFST